MLFQKNIEPRCTYCQRGTPLDEEKILCTKQGVVAPGGSCRSFKYLRDHWGFLTSACSKRKQQSCKYCSQ